MRQLFERITGRRSEDIAGGAPPQEEAPRERDVLFERLIAALPIGVLLVDASLRVRFANASAGSVFAFDPHRAIGEHLVRAIANVEVERRVLEALRGEASVAPLVVQSRTVPRTYRVTIAPLDGSEGAVLFVEDQTEALRGERASREFLSNVSHELRTPLSSVKLMLETVLASPDDEARELFLPQALAQVDRLASLVGRLLEQARTESGHLKLDLAEIDLETVARPIVATFEQQAARKGVRLQLIAKRPVRVEADAERLAQVIVNLIDNALRHTPSGGSVIVEVDATPNEAIIHVRDTGEGIPYRDLPHVFERFYVADRSRTRESGGAGLGLAIVKGIIDAHEGSISAESTLGAGTAMTIRIPVARNAIGGSLIRS